MSEHTPITAELRELMGGVEPRVDEDGVVTAKYVTPEAWDEFAHRCDAIDAVHAGLERENAELRQRVAVLDNDNGNMHDGWVRLPLDVDGECIRIGDVMEWVSPDEDFKPAIRTVDGVGEQAFFAWTKEDGRYAQYEARAYRHHHAPTVEDVLREMHAELDEVTALYVGEAIDSDERDRDEARIFAEYAAKLRLAGDAE